VTQADIPAHAPARDRDGIAAVADLLACPACRGALALGSAALRCDGCGAAYGIEDGIALLALHGTSDTWGTPQCAGQSDAYQSEYQTIERAAAYGRVYRRYPHKRFGTRQEWKLIRAHLAGVGHSRVILELPCGGGRITPAFADAADLIIEADIAIGQVRYGRAASEVATPCAWMTASAFHIPLRDDSVDGTICIRLAHHLPTDAERGRLIRELLRVSQRFVILTFYDPRSLKNLTRRLRHPIKPKPVKPAMTPERVAEHARAGGGRLVAAPPLSRIVSGHRFALILKDRA
jgi:ubiquinone/menaquinone biosynthesis C-methylase UbiE